MNIGQLSSGLPPVERGRSFLKEKKKTKKKALIGGENARKDSKKALIGGENARKDSQKALIGGENARKDSGFVHRGAASPSCGRA